MVERTPPGQRKVDANMPLRKTPKGWMWGSQGPFPTKAKALQVARAAYASGYKGEQNLTKLGDKHKFCADDKESQQ